MRPALLALLARLLRRQLAEAGEPLHELAPLALRQPLEGLVARQHLGARGRVEGAQPLQVAAQRGPLLLRQGAEGAGLLAQGVYPLPGTALDQAALTANGRPLADELAATLLVREAHAAWSFGRAGFATLRAGRARQVVADGLVHDDYATGLDVALDLGALGPPFELGAAVFQPSRDWPAGEAGLQPVVSLRADWRPSLFEHLGVFVATHRDATGSVADLFRGALVEDAVVQLSDLLPGQPGYQLQARNLARFLVADPSSQATLAWAGLSGSLLPLRTGTLYRSLARLLEDELIEEAAARDSTDERRRCYRITTHGRKVAALEAARLEGQVVAARARRLLPSRKLRP